MNVSLGKDIRILPYFSAHDASEVDGIIKTTPDTAKGAASGTSFNDLSTIDDRENVAQAIILRLLTPKGTLAPLGHASYGSRLHELIGRRKTSALRNLCRIFVLETVAQEPRVENKVVSFTFDEKAETMNNFVFSCEIKPKTALDPINITLEVSL